MSYFKSSNKVHSSARAVLVCLGVTSLSTGLAAGRRAAIEQLDVPTLTKIRDRYEPLLFQINGVNGMGIGLCDRGTGPRQPNPPLCINVYLESKDSLANVKRTFKGPLVLDGARVVFSVIGVIRPQPAVTVGN